MNQDNLRNEIAEVARELYEKSGRIEGRDLENWLEAEKIVTKRYSLKLDNKEHTESLIKDYIENERRRYKRFLSGELRRILKVNQILN